MKRTIEQVNANANVNVNHNNNGRNYNGDDATDNSDDDLSPIKGIDWESLAFQYSETKAHIKYIWKNGEWNTKGELVESPYVNLHICAVALHYGQSIFEGLKAFRDKNGKIRIFRPNENAKRLNLSARRMVMPEVPEDMFIDAVKRVVRANAGYVPPYESNGSLYIRPFLFGSGPKMGLQPSDEYHFIVTVVPVGDYYKGGVTAVNALIPQNFDRCAPRGTGNVKVSGNYGADLLPNKKGKEMGCPIQLYLDSETRSYIEEFGTSNFVGISKDGKRYITPLSNSVLDSITNRSLQRLAEHLGLIVEKRPIKYEEVKLGEFSECACVGTAVVLTPVASIFNEERNEKVEFNAISFGPVCKQLYETYRAIQKGDHPDIFKWLIDI